MPDLRPDAVVVGGGIAGLVAARDLAAAGLLRAGPRGLAGRRGQAAAGARSRASRWTSAPSRCWRGAPRRSGSPRSSGSISCTRPPGRRSCGPGVPCARSRAPCSASRSTSTELRASGVLSERRARARAARDGAAAGRRGRLGRGPARLAPRVRGGRPSGGAAAGRGVRRSREQPLGVRRDAAGRLPAARARLAPRRGGRRPSGVRGAGVRRDRGRGRAAGPCCSRPTRRSRCGPPRRCEGSRGPGPASGSRSARPGRRRPWRPTWSCWRPLPLRRPGCWTTSPRSRPPSSPRSSTRRWPSSRSPSATSTSRVVRLPGAGRRRPADQGGDVLLLQVGLGRRSLRPAHPARLARPAPRGGDAPGDRRRARRPGDDRPGPGDRAADRPRRDARAALGRRLAAVRRRPSRPGGPHPGAPSPRYPGSPCAARRTTGSASRP